MLILNTRLQKLKLNKFTSKHVKKFTNLKSGGLTIKYVYTRYI